MGATGWSHYVTYEADIESALRRLQQAVFARGDFQFGEPMLTDEVRKAFAEQMPPDWLERIREQAEALEEPMKTAFLQQAERMRSNLSGSSPVRPKRKPKTIAKLLELQGENGTHSILDMHGISARPEPGKVSPFPERKLSEVFGSERPSHEQVELARLSGGLEEFTSERWQGVYVIVYQDNLPSEILFAGCSGD